MPSDTGAQHSIPYMVDGDPLADVADIMQSLAQRVETLLPINGTKVVAVAASSTGTAAVVFPVGRFSVAPHVMVAAQAGATPYIVSVSAITAAGCNVNVRHCDGTSATANVTVGWTATPVTP